jgi:phage repressor protein C with HTH and peptisase S24 domain
MENPKYVKAISELTKTGTAIMKVFGNSMTPIIESGSTLTFQRFDEGYEKGDIVFCKVNGRYVDAHLITSKDNKRGYLISNNHGHDNGWTHRVFGKVIRIENEKI